MRDETDALTRKPVIFMDQDLGVAAMVGVDVYLFAIVVRRMGEWDSDRHCCQDDANPNAQCVRSGHSTPHRVIMVMR